jgi:hypothetical protein
MINWKRFGRKQAWPNFKVTIQHLAGGTEEDHERPQSGWSISGPRFETGISQI